MRARSPSEDEDTLLFTRPQPRSPSGVLFEEMVRQLAAPLTRPGRPLPPPRILHVQPKVPLVLEIPSAPPPEPVFHGREAVLPPATLPPPRRRARFKVPSLVFVMSIGIGFGLAHDAHARGAITSHARATARAAYALVHR